jgi:hypothetical protein
VKTTRFATIVQAAGAPSVYLLWSPAEKDATFQNAIKQHRVMSVHQETRGTKKDYGVIGFTKDPQAQFLVFPKSIRRFEGTRVVGVDYELLADDTRLAPAKAGFANSVGRSPTHAPLSKAAGKAKRPAKAEAGASLADVVPFDSPAKEKDDPSVETPPREKTKTAAHKPAAGRTAAARATRPGKADEQSEALPEERRVDVKRIATEIQKTLRELKAGKAVAAYERLQSLAESLEKPGSR